MKKALQLLTLTLALLWTSESLYSQSSSSSSINLVEASTGKVLGTMTARQFDILVKASDAYKQLLDSEEGKRLKLHTQDPIVLVEDLSNPIDLRLVWYDKNDAPLKTVTITLELPFKQDGPDGNWLRKAYRNFAEFALPVAAVVITILAIAL